MSWLVIASQIKARSRKRFFWTINVLFLLEWILLAFNVVSRSDWALENALVFVLAPIAVKGFMKGHLSKASYLLVFIFASLHIVGAHYTYSLVPYNEWTSQNFGRSLNAIFGWDRNNYDRIIHFFAGMFLFHPLRELFSRIKSLQGGALSLFTALVIVAASTLYEIIEFGAAIIFSGDLGTAYVGAQGDIWDAQKDQLLAIFGIGIGLGLSQVIQSADFRNWRSSRILSHFRLLKPTSRHLPVS